MPRWLIATVGVLAGAGIGFAVAAATLVSERNSLRLQTNLSTREAKLANDSLLQSQADTRKAVGDLSIARDEIGSLTLQVDELKSKLERTEVPAVATKPKPRKPTKDELLGSLHVAARGFVANARDNNLTQYQADTLRSVVTAKEAVTRELSVSCDAEIGYKSIIAAARECESLANKIVFYKSLDFPRHLESALRIEKGANFRRATADEMVAMEEWEKLNTIARHIEQLLEVAKSEYSLR